MRKQILTGMPMPPSQNRLWKRGSNRRMVSTAEYDAYKNALGFWALQNPLLLKTCRQEIVEQLRVDPNTRMKIDSYFFFKREALYSQRGQIKSHDTSNRLKALYDQLAAMLFINDRIFWAGSFSKDITQAAGELEYCTVILDLAP